MKLSELIDRLDDIEEQTEGDPDVLISVGSITVHIASVKYSPENAAFDEYVKIS